MKRVPVILESEVKSFPENIGIIYHRIIPQATEIKSVKILALTRWLSWLESHPIQKEVEGSILSLGMYLGCGFVGLIPGWVVYRRQ